MKLHWVELENWRQHAKTRIDFDEETTVIYGPNEAGKSTILEALSKGLFDRSGSKAEAIQRIKPLTASGNVTSSVRIEFSHDNGRYRVEKNFNLRSGTSLYRVDNGKSVLLDQDTADEQIIKMLEAEMPSPRGSKPSQWGAFQWLWANQSNRDLPDNKENDPTAALHLEKEEITLVTPKFQAIQGLVQDYYLKYFTRTGRISSNSPITAMEKEIEELKQNVGALVSKIEYVEGEKQKLEELESALPGFEEQIEKTKEELSKATGEAIDFSAIESALKASEAEVKTAEREVQDTKKALKELNSAAKKIDKIRNDEKKAGEELARLEAVCDLLDKRLQEKNAEVKQNEDEAWRREELTRDVRILWTKADTKGKIAEMEKQIKRLIEINEKIADLRQKEAPIAPTNKEIETLSQNQIKIEVLKENLASSGLIIDIVPGEGNSLLVEVDGEKIDKSMTNVTGTESVCVESPGLGKVTVRAELAGARDAKSDILRLEESTRKTLGKYGLESIDELKELNASQKNISNSTKELVAEKRGVDNRPIDEINLELSKLKEKYSEYEAIERTSIAIELNPVDSDLDKLVNRRETEEKEARKILDKVRAGRDEISRDFAEKKEELAGKRAERRHLSDELEDAINQQNETYRKYGSIENQETKLDSAKVELKKCMEKHAGTKLRYKEMEKGPISKIKRLEKQITNQEQIIRQQRASIEQLRGAIGTDSLEGTYSELAKAESEIEILVERLEKEHIRAESYKLLKETLESQYRSALATVIGPIQDEVKRLLRNITRFQHEEVELNEFLFPDRLGERGIDSNSLEFNEGSSGLKEILAVCVRLAVAKHLSEKEPQCLILDDPFVHVSSDRSNRMIELINEAIEEHGLQVIILTHRQMEFAGFAGRMIDIQSVK